MTVDRARSAELMVEGDLGEEVVVEESGNGVGGENGEDDGTRSGHVCRCRKLHWLSSREPREIGGHRCLLADCFLVVSPRQRLVAGG